MPVTKLDYLRECNTFQIALEDFQRQFCDRCRQKECSRSQFGKSRFDQRVQTWEERLFKNPPKMDMSDPRFQEIAAKRFMEISPDRFGPVPEIGSRSAWVDPQAVEPCASVSAPPPPSDPTPPPPEPEPAVQAQPEASTRTASSVPPALGLVNTPFKQGVMLGGRPVPERSPAPVYDPWAAPQPSQTAGVQIVKPGAKVKLGG